MQIPRVNEDKWASESSSDGDSLSDFDMGDTNGEFDDLHLKELREYEEEMEISRAME